jgi:hypothetical protein
VLERLGATEVDQQAFERLLGELPSSDVARLDEYLRTRRRAASELRARALGSARQHSEVLLMRVREEFEQLRR